MLRDACKILKHKIRLYPLLLIHAGAYKSLVPHWNWSIARRVGNRKFVGPQRISKTFSLLFSGKLAILRESVNRFMTKRRSWHLSIKKILGTRVVFDNVLTRAVRKCRYIDIAASTTFHICLPCYAMHSFDFEASLRLELACSTEIFLSSSCEISWLYFPDGDERYVLNPLSGWAKRRSQSQIHKYWRSGIFNAMTLPGSSCMCSTVARNTWPICRGPCTICKENPTCFLRLYFHLRSYSRPKSLLFLFRISSCHVNFIDQTKTCVRLGSGLSALYTSS